MTDDLREKLSAAASKHDGHVTNGSLQEICKVVDAEGLSRLCQEAILSHRRCRMRLLLLHLLDTALVACGFIIAGVLIGVVEFFEWLTEGPFD